MLELISVSLELFINKRSVGKVPAGEENGYKAVFDAVYEPGEITAVGYLNGREISRETLKTAGPDICLAVDCDRMILHRDCGDIAYCRISLTDKEGILNMTAEKQISISVEGTGSLSGFGSADPKSTENFWDTTRTTFEGQTLAVVRPGENAGNIKIKIHAEGCETKEINICVD